MLMTSALGAHASSRPPTPDPFEQIVAQSPFMALVVAFATAVEERDPFGAGHGWRTARYATLVAEALGWSEAQRTDVALAALVHDIGNIGIPEPVLRRRGRLTEAEQDLIRRHPLIGLRLLSGQPALSTAASVARDHHEQWDGRGYPRGISGRAITETARVVAVADVFDALTSVRPYRAPLSPGAAVAEIMAQRGRQFDPSLPPVLEQLWRAGALHAVLGRAGAQEQLVACPRCGPVIRPSRHSTGQDVVCPVCRHQYRMVAQPEASPLPWRLELVRRPDPWLDA
jgi:HD-GYP domain-containing protein (c-di-GMP phosphodiesterase class II)